MRSFSYRLVEFAVKHFARPAVFRTDAAELAAWLEKNKDSQRRDPPAFIRKKFLVEKKEFSGKWGVRPCWIVSPRAAPQAKGKALLFLHGGGMVMEANPVHWRAVKKIAGALGIPVWFPAYPLVPYADFAETADMLVDCYREMRKTCAEITVLGDSAGATYTLSLCHHLKRLAKENAPRAAPLPRRIILVSPVMATETDEAILAAMRGQEKRDVLLRCGFTAAMIKLLNLDMSRDNYFNAPLYGDFAGFPETYAFSGTWEIFYPQVPPFVQRLRDAGVSVHFEPGAEMMHIWPYMPVARESRAALEKIIGIIKQ
jgi:acetyl esterase/lipase